MKDTKKYKSMTVDEYWSLNKAILMNSKNSTEEVVKQVWSDIFNNII